MSGVVFKSGFNFIGGGFVSNIECLYFNLIRVVWMLDVECGSVVEL